MTQLESWERDDDRPRSKRAWQLPLPECPVRANLDPSGLATLGEHAWVQEKGRCEWKACARLGPRWDADRLRCLMPHRPAPMMPELETGDRGRIGPRRDLAHADCLGSRQCLLGEPGRWAEIPPVEQQGRCHLKVRHGVGVEGVVCSQANCRRATVHRTRGHGASLR